MWYRGLSADERVALKRKRIAFWEPKARISLLSMFVAPQLLCVLSRNSDWLEWAVESADAVSVKAIVKNKHLSGKAIHRIVNEPSTLMAIYKWSMVGEHPNVLPETVAQLIVSDGLIPVVRSGNAWAGLRCLRDSERAEWRQVFFAEAMSVAAFGPAEVSEPILKGLNVDDLVAILGRENSGSPAYVLKTFIGKLLERNLCKDLLTVIIGSPVVDFGQREEAFNRLYALPEVRVEFAGLPVGWVRRSFGFE